MTEALKDFLNIEPSSQSITVRSLKENKMKFTLFTAILFSMGWMNIEGSGGALPQLCCLSVSNTKIPVGNILDYSVQDVVTCPVRAVRFHTRKNKIICSDPDDRWTKKAVETVDRRKLTMESSTEPFKANFIPTTPTVQGMITTEGDGCSVSSCYSTIKTGHIPLHLMRALKQVQRSRNKKRLRKFQMGMNFFKE